VKNHRSNQPLRDCRVGHRTDYRADIIRVSHKDTVEDLIRRGKDLEKSFVPGHLAASAKQDFGIQQQDVILNRRNERP